MKFVSIIILVFLFIFLALIAQPAIAAGTLQDLVEETRRERQRLSTENTERLRNFEQRRADQRSLLAAARNQLEDAQIRGDQLKATFDANETRIGEMQESLRINLGDLGELFGVARQAAGDAKTTFDTSLVSAQVPGRDALVQALSESTGLASIEQLHQLRVLLMQEMSESGRVVRFTAETVRGDGRIGQNDVVRVGNFNLISGDKFMKFEDGSIVALARQPAGRYRRLASGLFDAQGGIQPMAVDPSGGQLLAALIQAPSRSERVAQGKTVGIVIIGLGVLGMIIALWRIASLSASGSKIRAQLRSSTPRPDNPLGRILSLFHDNRHADPESLELRLNEAILKELPRLERWQSGLKVIAAVAPLLGLLGTVLGMINTFQQITTYGTGDPKLMAGGISEALVTTMLGLFVAVPMVLLHSVVSSMSRKQVQVLEEQSAGIIAEQSERLEQAVEAA